MPENATIFEPFGEVSIPSGATAFAAEYDANGKMINIGNPAIVNGSAKVVLPETVYANTATAKLFILKENKPSGKEIQFKIA